MLQITYALPAGPIATSYYYTGIGLHIRTTSFSTEHSLFNPCSFVLSRLNPVLWSTVNNVRILGTHLFTLNEVIQGRMREVKHTYAFFLDVQKAFHRVLFY